MFGYRELGQLDNMWFTCAAEAPDGRMYVGCPGRLTPLRVLSKGRWSGTYAPALFELENGELTPVSGFDGDDRGVWALLPDASGIWAAGGMLRGPPMMWRLQGGSVVWEAAGTHVDLLTEIAQLGGEVYGLSERYVWKRVETVLEPINVGSHDPECSLVGLRERLYWLTEDGTTAWMEEHAHDVQDTADNDTLIRSPGLASYLGRLWSIRSVGVGIELPEHGRPVAMDTDGYQQLAWFDGCGWRPVASWYVADSGIYSRLAAFGGRLWLFGELWDAGAGTWVEQPCVGWWNGHHVHLARPWPYHVERVLAGERRAWVVGDDHWYVIPVIPYVPTTWIGPGRVVQLDTDLCVMAIEQEFGDGAGETPSVASVQQDFGDGSGEGPVVPIVRQEFGDGGQPPAPNELIVYGVKQEFGDGSGATPAVRSVGQTFGDGSGETPSVEEVRQGFGSGAGEDGERILWLRSNEGGPCEAVRITTGEMVDTDLQLRALVRADAEDLAVDDWASYQSAGINEDTMLDRPGVDVRVGVIGPATLEPTDVSVQLLRETE